MKKFYIVLLFFGLFLVASNTGELAAATYYVDGAFGNDNNSGALDSPWGTISKANSTLRAGDTVYIKAGTYPEQINPVNNGSAGSYITYENYSNDEVIISGIQYAIYIEGTADARRQYIKVKGIKVLKVSRRWFYLLFCDYVTLENCIFDQALTTMKYYMSSLGEADYCQFINCSWDASDIPTDSDTQHDMLGIYQVRHTLWKDCTFGAVSHTGLFSGMNTEDAAYNAVIDCTFDNKWRHGLAPLARAGYNPPKWWVVEGCRFIGIGKEGSSCPWFNDRPRMVHSIEHGGSNFIIRENIFYDCNSGIDFHAKNGSVNDNRIYHNTTYNPIIWNTSAGGGYGTIGEITSFSALTGNKYFNNIIWESESTYQLKVYEYDNGLAPSHNFIENNSFGKSSGEHTTSYVKWTSSKTGTVESMNANSTQWSGNITANPRFIDPANQDFNLQSGSPCIDAARHLTLTKAPGFKSIVLVVDDASFFFSGPGSPWNLANTTSDTLYIEDTGEVKIFSINYNTNTITLTVPASWGDNKKVYHKKYAGLGPDMGMGAYEYGAVQRPSGLRITHSK